MKWGSLLVVTLALLGACKQSTPAPLDAGAPAPAVDAGRSVSDVPAFDAGPPLSAEELAQVSGRLLFVSERAGPPQVHRLRVADGGEEVLTQGPNNHFPAGGVPGSDDVLVVETRQVEDQHHERLKRVAAGKKERVLHAWSSRARSPAWSPDGKWLLLESGLESFSDLQRIAPDGKKPKRMTNHPHGNFEPLYSPDGKEILFVSSRSGNPDLYRMPAEGGEPVALVQTSGEELGAQWSPDGQWIAYISSREGQDRAYLISADGKQERRLHEGPLSKLTPVPEPIEKELAWSPDSTKVAFAGRMAGEKLRIQVVEVATGKRTFLTDGRADDESPIWSADGKYLAFVSTRDGQPDLYLMRADGSGHTRLTRDDAPEWFPHWVR